MRIATPAVNHRSVAASFETIICTLFGSICTVISYASKLRNTTFYDQSAPVNVVILVTWRYLWCQFMFTFCASNAVVSCAIIACNALQ